MSIDIYMHMLSPPSRAVLVTAQHLGLEVNIKVTNVRAGDTKTPEYLKMNPSHTIPVIDDNGFVLFESRAIMTYLVNKYRPESPLYPKDPQQRAIIDKVLYYDASSVFPVGASVIRPRLFRNEEPPKEAVEKLNEVVEILVQMLGDQKYFAGDQLTLADISLAPSLFVLGVDSMPAPLKAWYQRVAEQIPQMKKANNEAATFVKKMKAMQNP